MVEATLAGHSPGPDDPRRPSLARLVFLLMKKHIFSKIEAKGDNFIWNYKHLILLESDRPLYFIVKKSQKILNYAYFNTFTLKFFFCNVKNSKLVPM